VGLARLSLALAQPVGITFAIAEFERIDDRPRPVDALIAGIEQQVEALLGAEPHMVAAMRADMQMRRELAMEDHRAAARAFDPEIVRHLALARHQRADLGPEIAEPVHDAAPAIAWSISRRMARAASAGSPAPVIGRPTTR